MKFLSDHDKTKRHLRMWTNQEVTLIAFFFSAAGSELGKSYLGLLRSLMYQLLLSLPDLIETLFPERWNTLARGQMCKIPWTVKELVKGITQLLRAHHANKHFCFLIDGLDEFEGDHRDLMDAIRAFNEAPTVKICVSSRPWSMFRQTYGSKPHLHMAVHELTKRDIDLYVRTRLETSTRGVLNHGELRQLGNTIRARSEGVFLWVSLAVGDLRKGIDERDDMSMLRRRLERYASELQSFFQHILDKIDPSYKRYTGRLLLMMMEQAWAPALIGISTLENYTAEGEFCFDYTWSPKSEDKLTELIDQGVLCANKWCRDILQAVNTTRRNVGYTLGTGRNLSLLDFCGYSDGLHFPFITDTFSFSHQTIYQFVNDTAKIGTLVEMAGTRFRAGTAWLYMFVGISRYAADLRSFIDFVSLILLMWMRNEVVRQTIMTDGGFANSMRECLVAFDRIGQNIPRPSNWNHWTHGALAEHTWKQPRKRLKCVPAGYQHSSFTSYLLSIDHCANYIADHLVREHFELSTDDQKQFLVESLLVPDLYEHILVKLKSQSRFYLQEDLIASRPQRLFQQDLYLYVVKVLNSGIDVNRSTQRPGCHFDYSLWQFFLVYLYSFVHRAEIVYIRPGDRTYRRLDFGIVVNIFRVFIRSGADPFAVVASEDLDPDPLETLARTASFLTAADIVEDLDTVCRWNRYGGIELCEDWIAGIGELKRLLAQASA